MPADREHPLPYVPRDRPPIPRFPDLQGKVALVTGGSKGIGAVTAEVLGANGMHVAINGRNAADLDRVAETVVAAGGHALVVPGDLCHEDAVDDVRRRTVEGLGPIDVLIAFAGGFSGRVPIQDIDRQSWDDIVASNLTSTYLCLRSVLPGMLERGTGSIVTMASNVARHLDGPLNASYAAAKAGIAQVTRHVALEAGPRGVRVNCVAPGAIYSERVLRDLPRESHDAMVAKTPLGRLGEPFEPALAALFLASDAASYVTGVTLDVAGGRVLQ